MKRKILAMVLLAAMVLTLVPAGAAAEPEAVETEAPAELLTGEKPLTRGQWSNAPVLAAGETCSLVLDTFDSDYTADQYWFAVNVSAEGQALQLQVNGIRYGTRVLFYEKKLLETEKPTYGNAAATAELYENGSISKALQPGPYYVMVRLNGSSHTSNVPVTVQVSFLDGDHNEGNNTWETATGLTENVPTYFNLCGDNDVDWFKITTTVPGEAIKVVFSNFDYTVPALKACLYAGTDLASSSNPTRLASLDQFRQNGSLSCKINEPGDYYLQIKPYYSNSYTAKNLKLRYEIVPGDDHEINDTYDKATVLQDNVKVPFTFNGGNDADWFYFETTEPNELVDLYLEGFNTDYSDRIDYWIYDKTADGYNSASVTTGYDVDRTHHKAIVFTTIGGHYIRIKPDGWRSVEDPLTIRIASQRSTDTSEEPNDSWQDPTYLRYGVDQTFSLPAAQDEDWFCIHVDEPNQTLKLNFKEVPANGRLDWWLYRGSDLVQYGNNSNPMTCIYDTGNGASTYYWMLIGAGDYYIRTRADTNAIFREEAKIQYELVSPDSNERNNTWKTATPLREGVDETFTLPADNDDDWFKMNVEEPNQVLKVTFSNVPAGGNVGYGLYAGADFEREGNNAGSMTYGNVGSGQSTFYWMLGEVDTYYLRTNSYHSYSFFPDEAQVRYELIAPDHNERNNTWKTATPLREGVDETFTLPSQNDKDWFKIKVDEPNQTLKITFSNVPAEGNVSYGLYDGAAFEREGNNAGSMTYGHVGSGTNTVYWMLGHSGTYYLRTNSYYSYSIFAQEAAVQYELIGPDAQEWNNDHESAVRLALNQLQYFTLPGPNDADWFRLDDNLKTGDKVTVVVGGVQKGNSVYCGLWTLPPFEAQPECSGWSTARADRRVCTFTVKKDGTQYLKLTRYDGSRSMPNSMYVRYSVARDATPVTGITIMDHESTLPVTHTQILNIAVEPYYATDQSVTWSSSQPGVAEVDQNGQVTAVAPGETTITVRTADGGYTASCVITVVEKVPVTGVEVTPAYTETEPKSLALDTSVDLSAKVLPDEATDRTVTWASSDESVLAVTKHGKVYAVGSGKAKITVTTVDGGHTAETWFSVPDETYPVTAVVLDQTNIAVYMQEEGQQLSASVKPTYATNPDVTWSSANDGIATVDQSGLVTAVATGYTTITVTSNENPAIKATCRVTVLPERIRVQGISFRQASVDLGLYAECVLEPVIAPEDATVKDVTWESSNKNVAIVSRTGKVTSLGLGYADITATTKDGGYSAVIRVNVSPSAALGDISNDGAIDVGDALLVLRSSVGLMTLSPEQTMLADVSGDGLVDAADAILILRYTTGLIDQFPGSK